MTGLLTTCPACAAPATAPFFRLTGLPVHGTAVFATPEQARAVATGDQDLVLCESCGVVFNRAFDESLLDYSGAHEESQHHSPRFAAYAEELSQEWVERHGLAGRHVVEVGCGSGDFAVTLLRAGVAEVTGIDPHFTAERVPAEYHGRLHAVPALFEPEMVVPGAAAVVCRHTIEHIPRLAEFGAAVYEGMRRAGAPVLLAEVPDLGRILTEGAFWDLQYEHCSYFTPATFASYLTGLGFRVPLVRTTYADQYIVAEAETTGAPVAHPVDVAALRRACEDFAAKVSQQITQQGEWLDERARAGDPVVVWGGGAKGLTFLNVLAAHTAAVNAVVDINPGLQHHFIGGLGLPIIPPKELVTTPPRVVLLMNPVYRDEVRQLLDELGLRSTELITV